MKHTDFVCNQTHRRNSSTKKNAEISTSCEKQVLIFDMRSIDGSLMRNDVSNFTWFQGGIILLIVCALIMKIKHFFT